DGIRCRQIEVCRALRVAMPSQRRVGGLVHEEIVGLDVVEAEVVVKGIEELGRDPLPATTDVDLPIVEFRTPACPWYRRAVHLGVGVVVVDRADIKTEVTEGFLPPAVEIHLNGRTSKESEAAHVRVPVAEVEAAR